MRVRRALVQLPAMEAVPAELIGGADLIRKPERIDPALLFDSGPFDPSGKSDTVRAWLNAEAHDQGQDHAHHHDRSRPLGGEWRRRPSSDALLGHGGAACADHVRGRNERCCR